MTFLTVDALLPQNLAVSLIAYNEEKSYYAMKNIMIWFGCKMNNKQIKIKRFSIFGKKLLEWKNDGQKILGHSELTQVWVDTKCSISWKRW